MRIVPGNARSAGARESQQDEFGFSDMEDRAFTAHGGVLAVVADGMGGLAMGREAARTAKTAMIREYEAKPPQEDVPRALHHALRQANAAVFEMARRAGIEEGKTGSTLAAAVVRGENPYWASVGDSRSPTSTSRTRNGLARSFETVQNSGQHLHDFLDGLFADVPVTFGVIKWMEVPTSHVVEIDPPYPSFLFDQSESGRPRKLVEIDLDVSPAFHPHTTLEDERFGVEIHRLDKLDARQGLQQGSQEPAYVHCPRSLS